MTLLRSVSALASVGLVACASPAKTPDNDLASRKETKPAASFSVPGARETSFRTTDGLTLRGWTLPAVGTRRATLLVVHGLKDHGLNYVELGRELAAKGYEVHSYDLRGHGRSDGRAAYVDAFTEHTDDLATVMRSLRSASDTAPWFVFGHSMGGGIVTRYALENPKGLAGIVLSAPALKPTPDIGKLLIGITKGVSVVAPRLEVLDLPNAKFSRDPAVVRGLSTDPLVHDRKVPARTAAQLLANMNAIEAGRGSFAVPFLAMHGSADEITNPEGSREFFAGTPALPGKELKIFPGLVHDLLHEPEKADVRRAIGDWLDARVAGK